MATVTETLRDLDRRTKLAVLAALALALAMALIAMGPIVRSSYTYQFPDDRTMLGVPYFLNVVSNLPFVVVGLLGLASLRARPAALQPALAVLYVGIFLTGFGSAHHHLAPSYDRVFFDRLPMTLAFAGVFAVALGDRVRGRLAITSLGPLLLVAVGSAVYWYVSGQLRPYVFVQGYPMIAIPALLILYRGRFLDGRHFMIAVLLYGIAKVTELYDAEIFEMGHLVSGHTLKHLFAGWATWHLVRMAHRDPRAS